MEKPEAGDIVEVCLEFLEAVDCGGYAGDAVGFFGYWMRWLRVGSLHGVCSGHAINIKVVPWII